MLMQAAAELRQRQEQQQKEEEERQLAEEESIKNEKKLQWVGSGYSPWGLSCQCMKILKKTQRKNKKKAFVILLQKPKSEFRSS